MTSDRAAEFRRRKAVESMKRSRLRKTGQLPPLPVCSSCGAKCYTDRWLPLCSQCARLSPLSLAAEQILAELRDEAWAEGE
jgi:hypothetical protein